MGFLSLIIVFLLEQLRPLPYERVVAAPVRVTADFIETRINAGSYRHGVFAWLIVVVPAAMLALVVHVALYRLHPLAALIFNIVVLYLTMGFRQFSHHYTEIQMALRVGDLERARLLLGEWRGCPASHMGAGEISRLAIEQALAASHRHVFAVLLWYILLPGPSGAVFYRLSSILADHWRRGQAGPGDEFGRFSQQAFAVIDWFPVRATASAFAIVGDFEDAVYCWRNQAGQWPDPEMGIVLASGAGALGVRLGNTTPDEAEVIDRLDPVVGCPADVEFMQSAVGMVWRATVFWMLLLFFLGLSSLVGLTQTNAVLI